MLFFFFCYFSVIFPSFLLLISFFFGLYIYEKSSSFSISFWEALNILKSRQCLPFFFGGGSTVYLREVFNAYYFIWGLLHILRSRQCLPFYFGKHCIFMRSCLHLPFYHVSLRWRKSYNSFFNPNSPWIKSPCIIAPPSTKFWFIFIFLFHVLNLRTMISVVD